MASANRILTSHAGSLIRPPVVSKYVRAIEEGLAVDRVAYEACLLENVTDVVQHQQKVGIDLVSDGEFGKLHLWSAYVLGRLDGFELHAPKQESINDIMGKDAQRFPEFYAGYFASQGFDALMFPVCTGPIEYTGQKAVQKDIEIFKKALSKAKVEGGFLPVVAPASAIPVFEDRYYHNEEKLLFALAEAQREEYKAIADAGLYVQIDDAFLPYKYDMEFFDKSMEEYRKWCLLRIDALNHALRGIPQEKIRYHICWGSFNSPHTTDVPMKDIADLVLRVNASAYSIEMANPRHEHEWRVWETVKLPDGKKLIPGVISHQTNVVEHPELVAERIVRLAKLVGRENVIGGTDCGFAQGPHVQRVHPSIQWAKLEVLAQGAALATKELWKK